MSADNIISINKFKDKTVFISIAYSGLSREISQDFADAFERIGTSVIRFDLDKKIQYYLDIMREDIIEKDKAAFARILNKLLTKDFMFTALSNNPDVFFSLSNSFIDFRTLEILKHNGTKNALYLPGIYYKGCSVDEYISALDVVFNVQGKPIDNINGNTKQIKLMPGCDIVRYFPKYQTPKRYGVSFIGSYSAYRNLVLDFLISNGVDVSIWGEGWDNTEKVSVAVSKKVLKCDDHVSGEEVKKIYHSSLVVLNLPREVSMENKVSAWPNPRFYSSAGCGCCIVAKKGDPGLDDFIDKEEIILYENNNDLLEKINMLLGDVAYVKYIGQKAVEKIRQSHSMTKRAEFILSHLL